MTKRIGVLLSGRGSNFEALADSVAAGRIPDAEISIVISNREGAEGVARAQARGIPVRVIPSKGLEREAYDRMVVAALDDGRVNLVCLAGFMRLLSPYFVAAFSNRILNIHPSLLPAFPGLEAQRVPEAWEGIDERNGWHEPGAMPEEFSGRTQALAWFDAHGIEVQEILTDNGSCYRSRAFAQALGGVTHRRTRPYRPQTNGKVERFNRTMLEEWAYVKLYTSEAERREAFEPFLHLYNHHRSHTALGGKPPISRVDNLPGDYS